MTSGHRLLLGLLLAQLLAGTQTQFAPVGRACQVGPSVSAVSACACLRLLVLAGADSLLPRTRLSAHACPPRSHIPLPRSALPRLAPYTLCMHAAEDPRALHPRPV